MGRFFTPITLFCFALLTGFVALTGYSASALGFWWYFDTPSGQLHEGSALFNAAMTAVMATLFAAACAAALWWRKRIKRRLRGNTAFGFPVLDVAFRNPTPKNAE